VSLGSGAVAGAAATVASYPFDLLRTTLAAQGEPKVGGQRRARLPDPRARASRSRGTPPPGPLTLPSPPRGRRESPPGAAYPWPGLNRARRCTAQ
jgi:hypothetical protein